MIIRYYSMLKSKRNKVRKLNGDRKSSKTKKQKKMERGVELIGSNLITIEEIQIIQGISIEQAEQEYKNGLKSFASQAQFLMVSQYCEYACLDQDEVYAFLSGIRHNPNQRIRDAFGLEKQEMSIDCEKEDLTPFHPDETHTEYQEALIWNCLKKGEENGNTTDYK